jgi:30S ribosomal protein S31
MGKGDQRTKRGKVHRGTFGVTRPKAAKRKAASASAKKPASKPQKA